jgi:hypothetical protein
MRKVERALTWCQPVASAHAAGRKPIENRKWRPTMPGRGEPLLLGLHAGSRWWRPTCAPTASPDPSGVAFCAERWPGMPDAGTLPVSALLGVVSVCAVVPVSHRALAREPWGLGPWCWCIDRVWTFPEPILHVTGAVSMWTVATEPLRALKARPHDDMSRRWLADLERARKEGERLEQRLSLLAAYHEPTHTFDWSNLRADQGALFGGAP